LQKKLQQAVTIDALMAKAQDLQDIAYATPGRNRVYTAKGFNDTIDYIVETLKRETGDYYDIEVAPAVLEVPLEPAPLTVGGVTYETEAMSKTSGGPYGNITDAPLIVVANLGCEEVC
jgi:carboxypeptidase Q